MNEKESNLEVILPFSNGGAIDKKYTCDGIDISPKIIIKGISSNAKSIAMIVDDPDAPMGTFTHWLIWDIPAKKKIEIPEDLPKDSLIENPIHAVQGRNDFGRFGYNGPCPPYGVHRYFFKIYVLDTMLNLNSETSKQELINAMKDHILQYKEVYGTYKRS